MPARILLIFFTLMFLQQLPRWVHGNGYLVHYTSSKRRIVVVDEFRGKGILALNQARPRAGHSGA